MAPWDLWCLSSLRPVSDFIVFIYLFIFYVDENNVLQKVADSFACFKIFAAIAESNHLQITS